MTVYLSVGPTVCLSVCLVYLLVRQAMFKFSISLSVSQSTMCSEVGVLLMLLFLERRMVIGWKYIPFNVTFNVYNFFFVDLVLVINSSPNPTVVMLYIVIRLGFFRVCKNFLGRMDNKLQKSKFLEFGITKVI
jgi:hypothetical protein